MNRLSKATLAAALFGAALGSSPAAWARFTAATVNHGNTASTGVLAHAGAPTSTHDAPTATTTQTVHLTWPATAVSPSAPLVSASEYVVYRWVKGDPSPISATGVSNPAFAKATITCAAGTTCIYNDTTALFGIDYQYEVQSKFNNWTDIPVTTVYAESLPPFAAVDGSDHGLNAVSGPVGSLNGPVVVVGDHSALVVCAAGCDSGSFVRSQLPGSADLQGVSYASSTEATIVGSAGTVLHCTSSCGSGLGNWATASTSAGVTATLRAVTYVPGAGGWAVGDAHTLLANTATYGTWTLVTSTLPAVNLRAVTSVTTTVKSTTTTNVWAVGDTGTIIHCSTNCAARTAGWTKQSVPTASGNLTGITSLGGTSLVAVGSGGTVLGTTTGTSDSKSGWTKATSSVLTGASLTGVQYVAAANVVYATAADGRLFRCNISSSNPCTNASSTWSVTTPTPPGGATPRPALRALLFADANHGWVVGASNTLLHTSNGTSWSSSQAPSSPTTTLTPSDLAMMNVPDSASFVTGTWPSGAAGFSTDADHCPAAGSLRVQLRPTFFGGTITTAKAYLKATSSATGTQARLLETTDGTAWYQVNGLSSLSPTSPMLTLDLTSATATSSAGTSPLHLAVGSDVQNLTLCFQALGTATVTIDMIHVDVN